MSNTTKGDEMFAVKTDEGYVGKYRMDEPLRSDMPAPLAYCYPTEALATKVAEMFAAVNGSVVTL